MTFEEAGQIAQSHAPVDLSQFRELKDGWYFPWKVMGEPMAGSKGIIVDKRTGRGIALGSAFSLERDLKAFNDGFTLESSYLIVLSVSDVERTLDHLQRLRITRVILEQAHGETWRIPQLMNRPDLRAALAKLPMELGPISVYFVVEELRSIQEDRSFTFELKEAPPTPRSRNRNSQ